MTSEEIYEEYKKLFVLIMETAGEETGNSVYKNVENILDRNKNLIEMHVDSDAPFDIFVCSCIVQLVLEIHGVDALEEMDVPEVSSLVKDMYETYLKRPTRKFAQKYGLSINELSDIHIKIITEKKKL